MKLYEIPHIRQENRRLKKRWFTSTEMDLFIWFRESIPVRFQFCFDKPDNEQAISWDYHRGLRYYLVDDGDTVCVPCSAGNCSSGFKQTPIFNDVRHQHLGTKLNSQPCLATIARNFLAASEHIDIGIADFIYARLMEYPLLHGAVKQRSAATSGAVQAGHQRTNPPAVT